MKNRITDIIFITYILQTSLIYFLLKGGVLTTGTGMGDFFVSKFHVYAISIASFLYLISRASDHKSFKIFRIVLSIIYVAFFFMNFIDLTFI